jgi:hypothetical protein
VEDFHVTLPHPANFALHKLIISKRRFKEEKSVKDKNMAVDVLRALMAKGDSAVVKKIYTTAPVKWQKKILDSLKESGDGDLVKLLKTN